MADENLDPQQVQKKLDKSLRTRTLLIVGGIIVVLIIIIVFTVFDAGRLFQGFTGSDPVPDDVFVNCPTTASKQLGEEKGGFTVGEMDSLKLTNDVVKACYLEEITNIYQEKPCAAIETDFLNSLVTLQLSGDSYSTSIIPSNMPITVYEYIKAPYQVWKDKECATQGDSQLAQAYTDEELENIENYCFNGSIYLTKDTYLELLGEPFTGTETIDVCLPIAVSEDMQATYSAMLKSLNIDIESCGIYQKLTLKPSNYRLTQNSLDTMIERQEEYCACPEGDSYKQDELGLCVYSCSDAATNVGQDLISYLGGLNNQTLTSEQRVPILEGIKDELENFTDENCYQNPDEKQQHCSTIEAYKYLPNVATKEQAILNEITQALGCCNEVGQALGSNGCSYTEEQISYEAGAYIATYVSLMTAGKPESEMNVLKNQIIKILEKLIENETDDTDFKNTVIAKDLTCEQILTILNKVELNQNEKEAFTKTSGILSCCPQIDGLEYSIVSETSEGEEEVYSCKADPSEVKESIDNLPDCSKVEPAISVQLEEEISTFNKLIEASYDGDNDSDIINTVSDIEVLMGQYTSDCKPEITGRQIVTILKKNSYKQENLGDEAKEKLSALINETLNYCYFDDKPGQILNIYVDTVGDIVCEQQQVDQIMFTSFTVDTQDIDTSEGQKATFRYQINETKDVTLKLVDSDGETVREIIEENVQADALVTKIWNAKDSDGEYVEPGFYTYLATIEDSEDSETGTIAVTDGEDAQPPTDDDPEDDPDDDDPDAQPPTDDDPDDDPDDDDPDAQPPTDDDPDDDDPDEDDDPDTPGSADSGPIEIIEHDVFPKGFNPLINDTKITYELSANAELELKILDESGVTVVTLIDDQEVEEGENFIWWNGTNSKDDGGEVVDPGTYKYKIVAKDPNTGETKDSVTGTINAVYSQIQGDFEDIPGSTGAGTQQSTTSEPSAASTNAATVQDQQNQAATMVVQNTANGTVSTSQTGPGVLIYLLFPLGGYLYKKQSKF